MPTYHRVPHPPTALRLCEATGSSGWLQRYVAPGQQLPGYPSLKARAYGGDYATFVIGRFRCIDERDVPVLLAAFALAPAEVEEAVA